MANSTLSTLKEMRGEDVIGYDTETTGHSRWNGALPFVFTFWDCQDRHAYVEFPVDPYTREVNYNSDPKTYRAMRRLLQDRSVGKVCHNLQFDYGMTLEAGIQLKGPLHDTVTSMRIAIGFLANDRLKPLCKSYLGIDDDDQQALHVDATLLTKRAKSIGWNVSEVSQCNFWLVAYAETIMLRSCRKLKSWLNGSAGTRRHIEKGAVAKAKSMKDKCRRYAETDAYRTLMLHLFAHQLLKENGNLATYQEEMDQVFPVMVDMEYRGLYVDAKRVTLARKRVRKIVHKWSAVIERVGGKGFNPGSYPQKADYFFRRKGFKPLTHTPAGNPQVDKNFLEYYASKSKLATAIVQHTKAVKADGTYLAWYEDEVDSESILHAPLKQCGAVTLRMSGRLQTIPKRQREGDVMLECRRAFGPRPGCVTYTVDWQQIEPRLFAFASQEPTLLKLFAKGDDVYVGLSKRIERITGHVIDRQSAKKIFLGKMYGLGVANMARNIRNLSKDSGKIVTISEAKDIINSYNESFPRSVAYMSEVKRQVQLDGYVTNFYGFRIPVDRDRSYRGVNYIIQSTAIRLAKRAMVRCHSLFREIGFGWIVLQIHDEMWFEFLKTQRPLWVLKRLRAIMEDHEGMFPGIETPVDFDKTNTHMLNKLECKF